MTIFKQSTFATGVQIKEDDINVMFKQMVDYQLQTHIDDFEKRLTHKEVN